MNLINLYKYPFVNNQNRSERNLDRTGGRICWVSNTLLVNASTVYSGRKLKINRINCSSIKGSCLRAQRSGLRGGLVVGAANMGHWRTKTVCDWRLALAATGCNSSRGGKSVILITEWRPRQKCIVGGVWCQNKSAHGSKHPLSYRVTSATRLCQPMIAVLWSGPSCEIRIPRTLPGITLL